MKTLKNKTTESRIREIINESVEDVLNRIGLINEMAVPLKTYNISGLIDAISMDTIDSDEYIQNTFNKE